MGVYKRNNTWWICYWHDNIRYRESGGRTKRDAETALAIRKSDIANSRFGIKNGKKIKFSEFSKVYMSNHGNSKASRETIELHIRHIQRFFGDILMDSFKPLEVEKYKRHRMTDGGVSKTTVNRELSCLRGMLNKAVEWEYLHESPIKKFGLYKEDNQRKRYLTQDEYGRLLYTCAEHLRPMVIFAVNTGMRRGEVLNLKWDEVDFDNGLLYVNKTKNKERRVVPINQTVRGGFKQHRQAFRKRICIL